MTQREALQMIFVAGFSTAKEVTSVSGRGVGMDVVRANIDKVGGSVEVESIVGVGTTVRLRVPLTLAIVPALVVESGGQSFVLPQNSVIELVYVPHRNAATAVERMGRAELYRLREELLPLVWLNRLLRLEQNPDIETRGFYIAVLESEERRFGLVVDDLKAPEEIVVKPLSKVLGRIGIFSGATVLGNGMLALILDVAAVGVRAGIRPETDTVPTANEGSERLRGKAPRTESACLSLEHSMVVYESWKRGFGEGSNPAWMAIPLSAVERIERVPLGRIEYADGRALLQYGGELLPLEDDNAPLADLHATTTGAMVTVLVCLRPGAHGDHRVGIVVRRVLDVSAGQLLAPNEELCGSQLALVNNRITTVPREFARHSGDSVALQEVA
jgi:two-component system chemotaxis sensor kinase CheA